MTSTIITKTGPRSLRTRRNAVTAVQYLVLLVGVTVSLAPGYYILRISVQSTEAYVRNEGGFSLESWGLLIASTPIVAELGHSVIVTLASLVVILAASSLAGYAFAQLLVSRKSGLAFSAIVVVFMIPLQSIVAPMYFNFAQWSLVGTFPGAVLVYAGLGLPLSVFLMTSFFRSIPKEIIEAALLDGVGHVAALWRVLLPMAAPALISVGVIQFLIIWNDLLVALLWLPDLDVRTLTVGISSIQGTSAARTTSIPVLMAASIVQSLPVVLLFVGFQRFIVRGLTAGAIR